jgi:hypothetical protein
MDDYLEKTCVNLGIKLVYTSNKITVLSAEVKNGIPTFRVNKVFKKCPSVVAQAIVEYYTNPENKAKSEAVIVDYLNRRLISKEYKIKPFSLSLKDEIIRNLPHEYSTNINDPNLVEFDITNMTVKDFWGKEENKKPGSSFMPLGNDLLELDIVIEPPVT